MPATPETTPEIIGELLLPERPSIEEEQINALQEALISEQAGRREDRLIFIIVIIILLDVVFFTVIPNLGGPIALLILELLVLIPLARRMGLGEIAAVLDRLLYRLTGRANKDD